MSKKFCIGLTFLGLQVGSIFYARFIPERFFCWAPYDSHVNFKTSVTINNKILSNEEAESRYQYKMQGWEQRSIHNIFYLITKYERTYGELDSAKVKINYSINGRKKAVWNLQP